MPTNDMEELKGQPCWILQTDSLRVAVTRLGGHMAPVTFFRNTWQPIEPYYVSPWQGESLTVGEPVLRPLRGDFFCMPFGASSVWKRQRYPTHGEPASGIWKLVGHRVEGRLKSLTLNMKTQIRPASVTKQLYLRQGENVIYSRHTIESAQGPMTLGHHATLAPPPKGRLLVSTGPFKFAQVSPRSAYATENGEYYALAPSQEFRDPRKVPTIWKDMPTADITAFPDREGFVDIVAFVADSGRACPAWTCAVAPESGYAWFSMRDPEVLPATLWWMENRGRHNPPWNGRNVCIGFEDICGYFALGLRASVTRNPWSERGIPTFVRLGKDKALIVNYIQGVFRVPRTFGRVVNVRCRDDRAEFISETGKSIAVPVRTRFLFHHGPAEEVLL